MTMDAAEVERLKAMMEWEGARTAPPAEIGRAHV